jgi:hypothetical protein
VTFKGGRADDEQQKGPAGASGFGAAARAGRFFLAFASRPAIISGADLTAWVMNTC